MNAKRINIIRVHSWLSALSVVAFDAAVPLSAVVAAKKEQSRGDLTLSYLPAFVRGPVGSGCGETAPTFDLSPGRCVDQPRAEDAEDAAD
jgi:hypothetical protein